MNVRGEEKKSMRLGCVNVRGRNVGKMEDLCVEWNKWDFDVVGVSETQLREREHMRDVSWFLGFLFRGLCLTVVVDHCTSQEGVT